MVTTKKDLIYYMNLPYEVRIEPAKEGGYVASVPLLKGCITQVETKEEIEKMVLDAKVAWLTAAIDDKLEIPEP